MGSIWSKIRGKPRLQPEVFSQVWKRGMAWRRHDVFEQVLITLCRHDTKMAEVLKSVATRAATPQEAEFLLRMLAIHVADWLNGIVEEGTILHLETLRKMCSQLGQQHAGYTSDHPFEDDWWRLFSEELVSAITPVSPDEASAVRAMIDFLVDNMRTGYNQAWDGMHR